jgi:hypothetical protein
MSANRDRRRSASAWGCHDEPISELNGRSRDLGSRRKSAAEIDAAGSVAAAGIGLLEHRAFRRARPRDIADGSRGRPGRCGQSRPNAHRLVRRSAACLAMARAAVKVRRKPGRAPMRSTRKAPLIVPSSASMTSLGPRETRTSTGLAPSTNAWLEDIQQPATSGAIRGRLATSSGHGANGAGGTESPSRDRSRSRDRVVLTLAITGVSASGKHSTANAGSDSLGDGLNLRDTQEAS